MPDPGSPLECGVWHETVLRQKYNDPMKLKNLLDNAYGQGRYNVKIKANRYILRLPEPLNEVQLAEMEKQIRFHYNSH
ncbi:hypothetical protein F4779DRAFT_40547 [Xylariaceae sp. FL0662B]|nr:hypothetical protein F4779DRAFT_40547 [Xylariaceae sp. FL0662B]